MCDRFSPGLSICFFTLLVLLAGGCSESNTGSSIPHKNTSLNLVQDFVSPGIEFHPMVRWWLPGGDVTESELLREIDLLASNRFGGAEIQAFKIGTDPTQWIDKNSGLKSYGTPAFYNKLKAVLEAARKNGQTIDLTMGSGWCAGGSFVSLDNNEKTLLSADITVTKNQDNISIPALGTNYPYELFDPNNSASPIERTFRVMNYHPEKARLITMLAGKIVGGDRSTDYRNLKDTVILDPASIIQIPDTSINHDVRTFNWKHPGDGSAWQIIAIYSMPVGSNPVGSAQVGSPDEQAYMVNPFDDQAVHRFYDAWLKELSPLLPYTEDGTLRAAFNDSYEFFAQRLYSDNLIEAFYRINGYDITLYMPALLQPAKDQMFNFFLAGITGGFAPEFQLKETDGEIINDRINYDYNKTISSLYFSNWYRASLNRLNAGGLKFRQQSYNPPLDIIKASGSVDIPETENNNIPTLKMVSSGAHLYGKSITSCESLVFYVDENGEGNFKITPEIMRQQIDQLMIGGINHIIYHGFPYVYNTLDKRYGVQNWSPFCSPFSNADISTTISESDPFWPYMKDVNTYAARLQYLMRQGTPSTDVLLYLPLFTAPTEERFTPVLTALNSNAIVWDWVNEELLEKATCTNGEVVINNKHFTSIILPDIESIPLSTIQALDRLSAAGARIVLFKELPNHQPSFAAGDYENLDTHVKTIADSLLTRPNSPLIKETAELIDFLNSFLDKTISFTPNPQLDFIRRDLGDNGMLMLLRNHENLSTAYTLACKKSLAYAFDARTGSIYRLPLIDGQFKGTLGGRQSLVILNTNTPLIDSRPMPDKTSAVRTIAVQDITLSVSSPNLETPFTVSGEAALGSWSEKPELKFIADPGVYTAEVSLITVDSAKRYILKLGQVIGVPEVSINGGKAVVIPFSPYELDITKLLVQGTNQIAIKLVVPLRNYLIGNALNGVAGDPATRGAYIQFAESKTIPTGIIGPIAVEIQE